MGLPKTRNIEVQISGGFASARDDVMDRDLNERLIAAAPDMLEALRACHVELTWCKAQLAGEGYESREGGSVCEALRIGKEAIAKATGGAS